MSEINLSSNIKGAIDDMLQGSIAGNISLIAGGGSAIIEPKSITENGTYEAPEGVDGYNPITVNVPSEEPTIENIFINYNGTFEASSFGWDGFGKVEVEVIPSTIPITITENGTYTPESADGYNPVVVNVPSGLIFENTLLENGVFNDTDFYIVNYLNEFVSNDVLYNGIHAGLNITCKTNNLWLLDIEILDYFNCQLGISNSRNNNTNQLIGSGTGRVLYQNISPLEVEHLYLCGFAGYGIFLGGAYNQQVNYRIRSIKYNLY